METVKCLNTNVYEAFNCYGATLTHLQRHNTFSTPFWIRGCSCRMVGRDWPSPQAITVNWRTSWLRKPLDDTIPWLKATVTSKTNAYGTCILLMVSRGQVLLYRSLWENSLFLCWFMTSVNSFLVHLWSPFPLLNLIYYNVMLFFLMSLSHLE